MLDLAPRLDRPDDFYEALIDAHRGLTQEQSALLNAKLILLLANQISAATTLLAAIDKARDGIVPQGEDPTTTITQ